MTSAYHYPDTLTSAVTSIRDSLPTSLGFPSIQPIVSTQEITTTAMAKHLESLASHFEQMESTLNDCEAGEELSEEDLRGMDIRLTISFVITYHDPEMNRDTDELPAIMAELEESVNVIQEAQ